MYEMLCLYIDSEGEGDIWFGLASSAGQMSHVTFSFVTLNHMIFSPL